MGMYFLLQMIAATITPYLQIIFRNKGYSYVLTGVLISLTSLVRIFFPLITSGINENQNKPKKLLGVIYLLTGILVFIGIKFNSLLLTSVFMVVGIGFYSTINPQSDSISAAYTRTNKSQYSKIRATGTLGYVVALVVFGVTGIVDEGSNTSIANMILFICLINFIYLKFFIGTEKGQLSVPQSNTFIKKIKQTFNFKRFSKPFLRMLLIITIFRISNSAINNLLYSYLIEDLKVDSYFTYLIAIGSFSELLMMLFLGKLILNKKMEPWVMILISCFGLTLRLLIYAFCSSVAAIIFAQVLHAISFGCNHIGMIAFISSTEKKENTSMAVGLYYSLGFGFSEMVGSVFGGIIIENLGYSSLFFIYSMIAVIASLICLNSRKLFNNAVVI